MTGVAGADSALRTETPVRRESEQSRKVQSRERAAADAHRALVKLSSHSHPAWGRQAGLCMPRLCLSRMGSKDMRRERQRLYAISHERLAVQPIAGEDTAALKIRGPAPHASELLVDAHLE